jgi:anti-sigma-K factor RskA
MMNRDELLELIPAYVLGALEEHERKMVENLLETDTKAQQLLLEYETVTAVLPFATPKHSAPAHLKADLRQRLAMRQAEGITSVGEANAVSRILPFPYRVLLSTIVATIVLILGVALFTKQAPSVEPTKVPRGLLLYNEIVEQANFQHFEVTPTGADEATGELVVSADGSQAVLRIAKLPTIAENERYQLWLAQENSVQSGGLFYWPTGHGPYYIIMPLEETIDQYIRFGMSIEPENGSPYPDSPSGAALFSVMIAQAG